MNRPTVLSLGSVNADFQVRVAGTPELGATLLARDFCRLSGGTRPRSLHWIFAGRMETHKVAQIGGEQGHGPGAFSGG